MPQRRSPLRQRDHDERRDKNRPSVEATPAANGATVREESDATVVHLSSIFFQGVHACVKHQPSSRFAAKMASPQRHRAAFRRPMEAIDSRRSRSRCHSHEPPLSPSQRRRPRTQSRLFARRAKQIPRKNRVFLASRAPPNSTDRGYFTPTASQERRALEKAYRRCGC